MTTESCCPCEDDPRKLVVYKGDQTYLHFTVSMDEEEAKQHTFKLTNFDLKFEFFTTMIGHKIVASTTPDAAIPVVFLDDQHIRIFFPAEETAKLPAGAGVIRVTWTDKRNGDTFSMLFDSFNIEEKV